LSKLNSQKEENELEREVRQELREEAELVVLMKCKRAYKELLMTGAFTTVSDTVNDGYAPIIPQTPTTPGRKKANLA
jgi:hypothetical protein